MRPSKLRRPVREKPAAAPAARKSGWTPKTGASHPPERPPPRPAGDKPLWLFLVEPGLGDLALKELKARKVVGRNVRATRLFLRNYEVLLIPGALVTGKAEGLRLVLHALVAPVFGRRNVTPNQLDKLAAAFTREKADGINSTVVGSAFGRQDLVRWLGKQLAERSVVLGGEPKRRCWLIVVDDAFYFGFPRFNHHEAGERERSPERTGALPQTIAAAAVFAANPGPDEVIWDPVCGSGSLLREAAMASPASVLLGSDRDEAAITVARELLGKKAVLTVGDAAAVEPGRDDISLTLANLPWGKQYLSDGGNAAFYETVLLQSLLHAGPAWRGVFVTSDEAALRTAASAAGSLIVDAVAKPKVRGVEAGIWRITRPD